MKSPTRLLLAVAGSAHLAACADITFPVVAMGTAGGDSNQFTDLHASIITVVRTLVFAATHSLTRSLAKRHNDILSRLQYNALRRLG
jgi:hypothetical protein